MFEISTPLFHRDQMPKCIPLFALQSFGLQQLPLLESRAGPRKESGEEVSSIERDCLLELHLASRKIARLIPAPTLGKELAEILDIDAQAVSRTEPDAVAVAAQNAAPDCAAQDGQQPPDVGA